MLDTVSESPLTVLGFSIYDSLAWQASRQHLQGSVSYQVRYITRVFAYSQFSRIAHAVINSVSCLVNLTTQSQKGGQATHSLHPTSMRAFLSFEAVLTNKARSIGVNEFSAAWWHM